MKNLPIFTTSNPALSRWQSIIEQHLKDENPNLSISEIRNLPLSQGCWQFVKMRLEEKKTNAPIDGFDVENISHQAYANEYFFDAVQEYQLTKNINNFTASVDEWDYSTSKSWDWFRTTGYQWATSWVIGFTNIYKDYKDSGKGKLNYSVVEWKLPKNAKIALIGDWGTENDDAKEFLRELIKDGVDCIIHLGDVYYSGTQREYNDKFINVIHDINSTVPVFGIPGNHEYYNQGDGFYHMIEVINSATPTAKQDASYFCLKTEDDTYQFVGLDTGINDGNPYTTYKIPPAPNLRSQNDFDWAIDKIKNFKGKTIMLSHHQLFSHVGGLNSDLYGDNCANPYLYEKFSPYFNKIAAWYWGHEHSFALYNEGTFGLNQGRLIGSSSYEQAKSDEPYADNYPLIPFSKKNIQLEPNTHYENDKDAEFYYPHAGAIITLREDDKPKIDYYSYPSWKNGYAPESPQLTKITDEIISNPTSTPTGIWGFNMKLNDNSLQSDKAPAICLVENNLFMVYKNPNDNNNLWWNIMSIQNKKISKINTPQKLPSSNHPTTFDTNNNGDTPSTNFNPVMVEYCNVLYLVYVENHTNTLNWCYYEIENNKWVKMGRIICNGKTLVTSKSPSMVTQDNIIYLCYLTNDGIVEPVIFSRDEWTLNSSFATPIPTVTNKTPFCPTVVNVKINNNRNLFMVYANTSNQLSLLRMDRDSRWHELGFINNSYKNSEDKGTSHNAIETNKSVSICTDGKFLKILYVTKSNYINWATMDLGFYNDQDQFVYYDFENGKTGIWSGGVPVLSETNSTTMQTQDFPAYVCNTNLSVLIYPGNSNKALWCSIQQNSDSNPLVAQWSNNDIMNENYFPNEGGLSEIYADTNPVICPQGKIITGIAFYQINNRIAPQIQCSNPDGSNPKWEKYYNESNPNMNDKYFPDMGGLSKIYADTNEVICPSGKIITGVEFYQVENRIALHILCSNHDDSNSDWASNLGKTDDYFPKEDGLTSIHADTNEVICPNNQRIIGVSFYQKENRLAPKILTLAN